MSCSTCGHSVPAHSLKCPSCGRDCGFPNVRAAEDENEAAALDKRVKDAFISATARTCIAQLTEFGESVKASKAVISRPLAKIQELLNNERISYVSFQKEVKAGARSPEDNEFDSVRKQYEEALFPHFSEEIIFALLSLTDEGMVGYGTHSMTLRDNMIDHRSTVFEENPHNFVEKHGVVLNQSIPLGFRATWAKRHDLAKAKLHSRIDSNTKVAQHSDILTTDNGGSGNSDWIEVHIYGTINRNAIESISGPEPKTKPDKVMWASMKNAVEKTEVIKS